MSETNSLHIGQSADTEANEAKREEERRESLRKNRKEESLRKKRERA